MGSWALGFDHGTKAEAAGLAASTDLVALSGGSANNTKGAWTELVASTTEPYDALIVSLQGGDDTTQGTGQILLDIGIGPAGSEIVAVGDTIGSIANSEEVRMAATGVYPVNVPRGSRIAARWQGQVATTSGLDAIVHGIRPAA